MARAGTPVTCEVAIQRARALAAGGGRRILGIVGMPGSGKSTLADRVLEALGRQAANVPMDGFHLANAELAALGRQERKGAVDTFDGDGYVALLRRLREPRDGEVVYTPSFSRDIDEPIAGAIPVSSEVPLVVTEGNYLLVDEGPWAGVRPLLDEVWYVEVDEAVRIERLVARHSLFGKSPAEALRWSLSSDQVNAELIATTRHRADLIVRMD